MNTIKLDTNRDIGLLGEILSDLKFHGLTFSVTIEGDYMVIRLEGS
jgi:hypothetical protein